MHAAVDALKMRNEKSGQQEIEPSQRWQIGEEEKTRIAENEVVKPESIIHTHDTRAHTGIRRSHPFIGVIELEAKITFTMCVATKANQYDIKIHIHI